MKHGPIALIDDKMPTLAIVPRDRVYDKMLSNLAGDQARSGIILLAVATEATSVSAPSSTRSSRSRRPILF